MKAAQGAPQVQFKLYVATLEVDVHPLVFHTNRGPIKFNVGGTAGQEKFGGLRDGDYIQNGPNWPRDLVQLWECIPIVLCDNQGGTKHRKLKYYDISAKSNYNFEKSFLWLVRNLLETRTWCLSPSLLLSHQKLILAKTRLKDEDRNPRPRNLCRR
ncbi:unnamed protein product [Nyctereutes procyonoides]|uniref:(raccoon dog) hypothetical protein n=1 Tax=Nyctereutes procyonoides TaxID=34880 RepID=A0A811Z8U3_NYCPR|nr:unnamed protein product [Nyctereutes procyonoides]